MSIVDRFYLVIRMMKNDDGKNGFYQLKKSPTILSPSRRGFHGS